MNDNGGLETTRLEPLVPYVYGTESRAEAMKDIRTTIRGWGGLETKIVLSPWYPFFHTLLPAPRCVKPLSAGGARDAARLEPRYVFFFLSLHHY